MTGTVNQLPKCDICGEHGEVTAGVCSKPSCQCLANKKALRQVNDLPWGERLTAVIIAVYLATFLLSLVGALTISGYVVGRMTCEAGAPQGVICKPVLTFKPSIAGEKQ
jgi:hypothetical protein